MLRWLLPAALGACATCPVDQVTDKQFAPVATYHDDIVACANHADCNHLCIDLFKLDKDDLESCRIDALLKDGAWVAAKYSRPGTCAADDDTIFVDGDDGGDISDDCTLDDSCDPPPPPDDPCDDGSCDPPPDDDGGDTGGGDDDGSEIRKQPTSPRSTPAPRASR